MADVPGIDIGVIRVDASDNAPPRRSWTCCTPTLRRDTLSRTPPARTRGCGKHPLHAGERRSGGNV